MPGGRCANPFCRRETGTEGHGHHIVFRSMGGRTELANGVWICVVCHAQVHAGYLRIEGDPIRGLRWIPAVADATRRIRSALSETIGVPEVRLVESRGESGAPDSAIVGGIPEQIAKDVGRALVKLGCSRSDAEARLEAASTRLAQAKVDLGTMDTGSLLREALRG